MHQKLIDLHRQLRRTEDNSPMPAAIELVGEILGVFGLPPNQGYEEILLCLLEVEVLPDDLIDKVLIRLSDEGAYYQTLSKLKD
jgi:hypothetical protein